MKILGHNQNDILKTFSCVLCSDVTTKVIVTQQENLLLTAGQRKEIQ